MARNDNTINHKLSGVSFVNEIPSGVTVASIVPRLKKKINEDTYKSQRICKICALNLKDSKLAGSKRKYYCKFCYEAVCEKCSEVKCFHVKKRGLKRICIACFNEELEEKVLSKLNDKSEFLSLIDDNEPESANTDINYVKQKVSVKRKTIEFRKDKLAELRYRTDALISETADASLIPAPEHSSLSKIEADLRKYRAEFEEINQAIAKKSNRLDVLMESINNNCAIISQLSQELLRRKKLVSDKIERKTRGIDIVKGQICCYRGILSTLENDINKIRKQIQHPKKSSLFSWFRN